MAVRVHVHAGPGCNAGGHRLYCAAFPAERGCFQVKMGKNAGKFVCIHVENEAATVTSTSIASGTVINPLADPEMSFFQDLTTCNILAQVSTGTTGLT